MRNWYLTTESFLGNSEVGIVTQVRSMLPGFVPIRATKGNGAATILASLVAVLGRL